MPMFMGASKKQAQLIENLPGVFKSVLKRHNLAAGDFPDLEDFRSKLKEHEFSKFQVCRVGLLYFCNELGGILSRDVFGPLMSPLYLPPPSHNPPPPFTPHPRQTLRPKMIDEIETVMGSDFPRLMEALPRPDNSQSTQHEAGAAGAPPMPLVYDQPTGRGATAIEDETNPWGDDGGYTEEWVLADHAARYQGLFQTTQTNGLVSGTAAKGVLTSTGLAVAQLRKIWELR